MTGLLFFRDLFLANRNLWYGHMLHYSPKHVSSPSPCFCTSPSLSSYFLRKVHSFSSHNTSIGCFSVPLSISLSLCHTTFYLPKWLYFPHPYATFPVVFISSPHLPSSTSFSRPLNFSTIFSVVLQRPKTLPGKVLTRVQPALFFALPPREKAYGLNSVNT